MSCVHSSVDDVQRKGKAFYKHCWKDIAPSLRSSASTMSARQPRVSSSTNTSSSAERSSSLSAAIPTSTRPVSAGKRTSLASLSRLVGSSYNRSKLNIETSAPPTQTNYLRKKTPRIPTRPRNIPARPRDIPARSRHIPAFQNDICARIGNRERFSLGYEEDNTARAA